MNVNYFTVMNEQQCAQILVMVCLSLHTKSDSRLKITL